MRRLLTNPIILLVFILISVIFYVSLDKTGKKRAQSAEVIAEHQKEVEKAKENLRDLEAQTGIESDEFEKEKIIRDQLLMIKEGEYAVQIAPEVFGDPTIGSEEGTGGAGGAGSTGAVPTKNASKTAKRTIKETTESSGKALEEAPIEKWKELLF